ncbi:hypothetical protein ACWEQC_02355 [Streptomyces shenzhenensis]
MIPAMPATATTSRQTSVAALRFGRLTAMGTVTVLLLIAGVWGSWGDAQHVMLAKGRESGTVKVTDCAEDTCSGPFTPGSAGAEAREVVIARTVAVRKGRTYAVVVKPGTDEVVRSGPAGIFNAWVPLGGALLLASVVVAGGLRLRRIAWIFAGSGLLLVTATFMTL